MFLYCLPSIRSYSGSSKSLGKPALNDLKSGLSTAPVMFAQEEFPQLNALVERKFGAPGDIDIAMGYVNKSEGVQRTAQLAIAHAEAAARYVCTI